MTRSGDQPTASVAPPGNGSPRLRKVVPVPVSLAAEVLHTWRPTRARLTSSARSGVTSLVVLAVATDLAPGVSVEGPLSLIRLSLTLAVLATVLRPVLAASAAVLGGVGSLLLAAVLQSVLVGTAIALDPGVQTRSPLTTFGAAWFIAVFAALANWLADAGGDDAFLATALRQMRRDDRRRTRGRNRRRRRHAGMLPEPGRGVLFVQVDGLAASLLRWSVLAGNLPTLGRWIRSGTHTPMRWHTGVPSTTPGSQAGLLHGRSDQIPAFRWYEKDTGRVLVANRPKDAAEIEKRLSDGRGLLADDGVSISNLFSGDAPTRLLTFSDASLPHGSTHGYAVFLTSPSGFARALVLSVGEMVKELWQARRQRRLDVQPRVERGGAYVLLRAATNVLLRDVNVSLIAGQLSRGANAVYCDFVDYDEVAHHAGPTRAESLRTLEGLDRVLATLEQLAAHAPRPYDIVVLSDHGQSQGATFRQRYGETLEDVVCRLMRRAAGRIRTAATGREEMWGPVAMLLDASGSSSGVAARAARRIDGPEPAPEHLQQPDVVVVASGNLAMVSLPDLPGRARLDEIERSYPDLVAGLVAHPGVGTVVVDTDDGPVALGRNGRVSLDDGAVLGDDPLVAYGDGAREALLHHARAAHVGDLVVISSVDALTEEVAAFEELVGSHGGLGGAQTEGVLVYPSAWSAPGPLVGSDAVHHQLVRWLEELGQRRHLRRPADVAQQAADATPTAVR